MDTESFWSIIKNACKQCFRIETSTEAGRVNLLGGIFVFGAIIILCTTGIGDRIMWLIDNNYQLGAPWYVSLILIILLIVYFLVCMYFVNKANKTVDERNDNN